MKNTVRRILAITIALIMVFGAVPAFAAEAGDTVKWYNDEGTDYEIYEITDTVDTSDKITIEAAEGRRIYSYILNVESTGYYAVYETGYPYVSYAKTFENGVAYGDYDYYDTLNCDEESNCPDAQIMHFNAGENFLIINVYDMKAAEVSYEFLGEEITKVGYEQEYLEDLIIGCEVAEDHNFFQLQHFSYIDLTFSSGKTVNKVFGDDVFYYDAPLKEGKNTGYMEVFDFKEPITFTAYPVSKYIESMEITNAEKLLDVKVNFLGEYKYPNVCEETVTIKFTDGTKLEIQQLEDIDRGMDFINGHHYNLITNYEETVNGFVFELGFSKHMFCEGSPILYSAPCEVIEMSFSENLKVLSERIIRIYLNVFADIDLGSVAELDLKALYYAHKSASGYIADFFNYYF